MRSCMPYAGHPAALRQWAARWKLPEVPDPAHAAFLHGAPGRVFDASSQQAKLALISSDDGICAVVTDKAGDQETAEQLEQALRASSVRFRLVIERDDKLNPKLHHREYLAAKDKEARRILAATVRDRNQGEVQGEAMLTAAPE